MSWGRVIVRWIRSLWPWGRRPYRATHVEELPLRIAGGVVYVVGETGHVWAAAMVCPCGCGETIHMNLLPDARPRWKVEQHTDRSVSLHPSVWRQKGCGSHFFLRRGKIIWCNGSREADVAHEPSEARAASGFHRAGRA